MSKQSHLDERRAPLDDETPGDGPLAPDPVVPASVRGDQAAQQAAVPLWRNWAFQLLWIGSSTATLGVEVTDIAYPLLILAITGSPATAGLFGFLQFATMLLLGLPVGTAVDRWNRRRVLLFAEAGRALLIGSVAAVLVFGHLTLPFLMIVAVLLGVGATFGGPVRMLMIRAVVPDSQLTSALTQDEVREGATGLGGPPLGGLLFGIGQALPFIFGAVSFAVSFACALMVRIPPAEPRAAADDDSHDDKARTGLRSAFVGVQELWRVPLLRCALVVITTFYLTLMALVLVVIVVLRSHGAGPGEIGLALTGTAVGTLLGSVLVRRLHRLVSPGWLLIMVSAIVSGSIALLAVPLGPFWVFGVLLVAALTVPAMRVLIDILIFRQVPDHRRGRTIMATMTAFSAGPPVGVLLAGLLLQYFGGVTAVLVLAGLQATATVYGLLDRRVVKTQWPAP